MYALSRLTYFLGPFSLLGFPSEYIFHYFFFSLFTGKTSSWEKSVKHGGGVKGQCMQKLIVQTHPAFKWNILSTIQVVCHLSQWCFLPNTVITLTVKVHTSSQASLTHATVNQARFLKCFCRAKHTHIVHSRAVVGQVGLESRRGKVNASGSLSHSVLLGHFLPGWGGACAAAPLLHLSHCWGEHCDLVPAEYQTPSKTKRPAFVTHSCTALCVFCFTKKHKAEQQRDFRPE